MKLLNVILAMLLVAATAAAQSPYAYPYYATYGYPNYSSYGYPYYPSYSYPFSPNQIVTSQIVPLYLQPNYVPPDQFERRNTAQVIDDLTSQVHRLTDEVERLQSELTAATAPPPPVYVSSGPSAPTPPAKPVILIFKDERRIESQGYAVAGDTLWIFTEAGNRAVALSNLNLEATRRENLKRGIDFLAR